MFDSSTHFFSFRLKNWQCVTYKMLKVCDYLLTDPKPYALLQSSTFKCYCIAIDCHSLVCYGITVGWQNLLMSRVKIHLPPKLGTAIAVAKYIPLHPINTKEAHQYESYNHQLTTKLICTVSVRWSMPYRYSKDAHRNALKFEAPLNTSACNLYKEKKNVVRVS